MANKIETLHFRSDAFSTDFKRELSYDVLGRDILNCAENHASKRGFGFSDLLKVNHSWVLSRLSIEMRQMPPIYSNYHIDTWIENVYRMFTNRNFCIRNDDGEVYGYARSIWAMIDNTTRQPLDLVSIYGEEFYIGELPEGEPDAEVHLKNQNGREEYTISFYRVSDLRTIVVRDGIPSYCIRSSCLDTLAYNMEHFDDASVEFKTTWQ